jgi:hypothetical protein
MTERDDDWRNWGDPPMLPHIERRQAQRQAHTASLLGEEPAAEDISNPTVLPPGRAR